MVFGIAGETNAAALRYKFTSIPAPNTPNTNTVTAGWGVGKTGTVVGADVVGGTLSGFSYAKNVFASFNAPNAAYTIAHAIAPNGVIVGETALPGNAISGFMYSKAGAFTFYTYPGAVYTRFTGINSHGVIAGNYYDGSQFHGITYKSGVATTFNFPGGTNTACTSINDSGEVVGNYVGSDGRTHAYMLIAGQATSFDYPGATYSDARGVNDAGDIGGFYKDAAGATFGFVRLANGTFQSIAYPNAIATTVYGINGKDEITGQAETAPNQYIIYHAGLR
jgi:hypothetical protein